MDLHTPPLIDTIQFKVSKSRINKLLQIVRWIVRVSDFNAFIPTGFTVKCQVDKQGEYPVKIRTRWDRSFMTPKDKRRLKSFEGDVERGLSKYVYNELGLFRKVRIDASFKNGGFGFRLRVFPRAMEDVKVVPTDVLVTGNMDNEKDTWMDFVDSRTAFEDIQKTVDARFKLDTDTFRALFETPWE